MDTRKRFMNQREMMMLFSQDADTRQRQDLSLLVRPQDLRVTSRLCPQYHG